MLNGFELQVQRQLATAVCYPSMEIALVSFPESKLCRDESAAKNCRRAFSFSGRLFMNAALQVLALFLGLLYLNNTLNQNTIMNYNGALFYVLAEMTFPVVFGLLTVSITKGPPSMP